MKIGNLNTLGELYAGGWQLVDGGYKYFDAAATSYTFSGLKGDTDEEYRLVAFLNDTTSGVDYRIRFNGDDGSNYGFQRFYSVSGTIVTANRSTSATSGLISQASIVASGCHFIDANIYSKSGTPRTVSTKSVAQINGTDIRTLIRLSSVWSNVSAEVTSITVFATGNDGISIGSSILLFKRQLLGSEGTSGLKTGTLDVSGSLNAGVMQKIYETDLAETATSLTISGLNGNTDLLYELIIRNVANGNSNWVRVQPNSDTTTINYGYQYIKGVHITVSAGKNAGVAAGSFFTSGTCNTTELMMGRLLLFAPTGHLRPMLVEGITGITGTTITEICLSGHSWNDTATNISSLTLVNDIANGFNIGTHIELWAYRAK